MDALHGSHSPCQALGSLHAGPFGGVCAACTWEWAGNLRGCCCSRSSLILLRHTPKQTEQLESEPSLNIISGCGNMQLCGKGSSLPHLHLGMPCSTSTRPLPASLGKCWLCAPICITLPWKMDLALSDLIPMGLFLQNWNEVCTTALMFWLTFHP